MTMPAATSAATPLTTAAGARKPRPRRPVASQRAADPAGPSRGGGHTRAGSPRGTDPTDVGGIPGP